MARILVGAYMVRYPLGGMLSMSLQIVVGLRRLGHDVMVVERSGWPDSCFDPSAGVMTDNCTYGTSVLARLLARFGLKEHWCFVDQAGRVHGCSAARLRDALASWDVFVDAGTHGLWLDDLGADVVRVLLDGEPGWTQMRWSSRLEGGDPVPQYDVHFTVGQNVGTERSTIPTIGREWRHTFYPVLLKEFAPLPADDFAPYTSVMNWQSHEALVHGGVSYGQKDVEFERFVGLPTRVRGARFQLAIAGEDVPHERLRDEGWHLRHAHEVTASYDGYREFVRESRAEISVAKNVFVATRSGWLGDRNAAYLAAGRPVVLQDTGISEHLPCGEGLFAVENAEQAAAAVEAIEGNYGRHSAAAHELAREFLATDRVLPVMLAEAGL